MKKEVISYEYLDDETVSLHLQYKSKFPKIKDTVKQAIAEYIKASFLEAVRGLKDITVSFFTDDESNETEIDILMTLEKPNRWGIFNKRGVE